MYSHYTNIDSVFNMLQSEKVWFNSLAFMNDEMEGYDLHSVLSDVLQIKYGSDECKSKLALVDTTIGTHLRFQFSFSASTLSDDISQWRAYTKLGQGICVEFEEGFIEGENINKVECLYSKEDKRKSIIRDRNLKANDATMNQILDTQEGIDGFVSSIIHSLVRFKNKSFIPENEVRWVKRFDGLSQAKGKVQYRPHRLGLTMYHEVPINLKNVKKIILGPQIPKQNLKTFEDFLITIGCPALVVKSEVTLR